jgi:hypothetical protein
MSRPTEIYREFTRELLENFVWQLQLTGVDYDEALQGSVEAGTPVSLPYAYECPSEDAAQRLRDYIHQQAPDEIAIARNDDGWVLRGTVNDIAFELPLMLRWVGYMCDAGSQFGCRFDGWTAPGAAPAAALASDATPFEEETEEDDDEDEARETPHYPHYVIARLPEPIEPLRRASRYEDPLTAALKPRGLGEVTGGGSQLNANGIIEFVEIEIGLANLGDALAVVQDTLRKLGVPPGSELHVHRTTVIPIGA